MQRVGGIGLDPEGKSTLWRAWVGFNLSHSVGLVVGGAVILRLALAATATTFGRPDFLALALGLPVVYLAISVRHWFAKPTQAFVLASLLIWAGVVVGLVA